MSATPTMGPLLLVKDVAFFLAKYLGPGKQWTDFLNDCRQNRGALAGLTLLPVARVSRGIGRGSQPAYRPGDVTSFIRKVRDLLGTAEPFPFEVTNYNYAPAGALDEAAWRVTTATPV